MIRRDTVDAQGRPCWLLISQCDHARLAGQLAEHWGAAPFASLTPRDVVLPTIYRHDDGWQAWEQQPGIDPQRGRPLSFVEMPTDVAHDIWTCSIERVADLGPLAQYLVARHFADLRRRGSTAENPSSAEFVRRFDEHCAQWLERWQQQDPTTNTEAVADLASRHLQLFDLLSLWLSFAEVGDPLEIVAPDRQSFTLRFVDPSRAVVTPWPWTVESLDLSITARRVPQDNYRTADQLAAAPAESIDLRWHIERPRSRRERR